MHSDEHIVNDHKWTAQCLDGSNRYPLSHRCLYAFGLLMRIMTQDRIHCWSYLMPHADFAVTWRMQCSTFKRWLRGNLAIISQSFCWLAPFSFRFRWAANSLNVCMQAFKWCTLWLTFTATRFLSCSSSLKAFTRQPATVQTPVIHSGEHSAELVPPSSLAVHFSYSRLHYCWN